MNRQRSASHCPHHTGQYDGKSVSPSGHKCCCAKAKHTSGGIALGHGDTPFGAGNNLDPNVAGRSKRASSLRILNKRFNFHFTNQHNENQQTKNGERRSSNVSSETNSGMRQPTSATYHHGSSANHQIIYHSNNILNRNSKKQKHHHVKLNELDDRSLKHIFEYLTLKERLQYERVCRRWQALIRTSFLAPASLKIGEHSVKCNCQCSYFPSWDLPPGKRFKRDEAGYIIYPNSVLKYLLPLCRNLKCLNFSHCYLDDQALQIIIAHSDTIECLHLNDIRLEEGNDDLETLADFSSPSTNTTVNDLNISSTNRTANSSDELMSNDHHPSEENTITSAVSQFATEHLAVFGGFVRKLSTRKPAKKATHGNGGAGVGDQVINNVNIGRSKQPAEHLAHSAHQTPQQPNKTAHQRHQRSGSAVTRRNMVAEQPENSNAMRGTRTNMPTNVANNGKMGNGSSKLARKSVDPINVGLHYKLSNNLSYPNINTTTTTTTNTNTAGHTSTGINHMEYMNYSNQPTDVSVSKSSIVDSSVDHRNSSSPNNGPSSGKTSTSNIASAATAAALSNAIGQRRAQHRRREWSRHRSSNNNQNTLQMQLQLQQDKLQQQHNTFNRINWYEST
ncbi:hypothetical protein BLOT_005098 [Blomia tropicalis]|nr:hypothetical protein BLOT_005098 [Blomia tropicalis]